MKHETVSRDRSSKLNGRTIFSSKRANVRPKMLRPICSCESGTSGNYGKKEKINARFCTELIRKQFTNKSLLTTIATEQCILTLQSISLPACAPPQKTSHYQHVISAYRHALLYWIIDRTHQKPTNQGDYFSKHHPPEHHIQVCPMHLHV